MASTIQNAFTGLHRLIYRASGGRIGGRMVGLGVLLLTTTGSKSGQPRTTPLGYVRDGEAYVIIASNGGADRHPAWYFNLQQQPRAQIQLLGETFEVNTEMLHDAERERVWSLVLRDASIYGGYEKKTSRAIPLVRLTRA